MNPAVSLPDYDYTIIDTKGRRGVKDGKEFPITEEEWQKAHPEHRTTGCTECTFVQDIESLFIYLVPRELKEKAVKKPLFLGKFTMIGWNGHSGFYLFKCKSCGQVYVDYPHGYTDFGLMFLRCEHCQAKISLEVTEEKALYERERVFIPKPTREERIRDLNEALARATKGRNVRVVVPGLDEARLVTKNSRINFWNIGLVLLALWTLGIFLFTHPSWRPF
jgi:hypothetical protein